MTMELSIAIERSKYQKIFRSNRYKVKIKDKNQVKLDSFLSSLVIYETEYGRLF